MINIKDKIEEVVQKEPTPPPVIIEVQQPTSPPISPPATTSAVNITVEPSSVSSTQQPLALAEGAVADAVLRGFGSIRSALGNTY